MHTTGTTATMPNEDKVQMRIDATPMYAPSTAAQAKRVPCSDSPTPLHALSRRGEYVETGDEKSEEEDGYFHVQLYRSDNDEFKTLPGLSHGRRPPPR